MAKMYSRVTGKALAKPVPAKSGYANTPTGAGSKARTAIKKAEIMRAGASQKTAAKQVHPVYKNSDKYHKNLSKEGFGP